jgi:NADH-quinone oxidoreductase subunit F
MLLPGLHALVDAHGWATPAGMRFLGDCLGLQAAEVWGVATFYDLIPTDPVDGVVIRRCSGVVCESADGAGRLGGATSGIGYSCLGQCDAQYAELHKAPGEPYVAVRGRNGSAPPTRVAAFDAPGVSSGGRVLARILRLGQLDSMHSYLEAGGGEGLRTALRLGPERSIAAIERAGLRGRGGAAFPTATKLRAVRESRAAERPRRYVVCNGDESEPGTFKDRILMERDPYAVLEGLLISAAIVEADRAVVYIRGEYPEAISAMGRALREFTEYGWVGQERRVDERVLPPLEVSVRTGGGAYVCGEETALLNSIEGFRGEPRAKPPFPSERGLFGGPTLINNVETLCHQVDVLRLGAEGWRSVGTEGSPGTRLFSVSGAVGRSGVFEWPLGVSLRQVLEGAGADMGVVGPVLLGGAAGSFLAPDGLDMTLDFESAGPRAASMGSGAVMVFGRDVDTTVLAHGLARFFAHESCGKCVPCRGGTHQILRMFEEGWEGSSRQVEVLKDLRQAMSDASICGLGHTATVALSSMVDLEILSGADR